MSRLTDHELDQLLEHAGHCDRRLKGIIRDYEPIQPRIVRLLNEQRELREQAAERTHMAELDPVS